MKNKLSGSGDITGGFKEGGFFKWGLIDWAGYLMRVSRKGGRGYAVTVAKRSMIFSGDRLRVKT